MLRRAERADAGRAAAAGFTLLEVIIAVFLFGSVIGFLVEFVSENLRKLGVARDELVATELAQQSLREVATKIARGETVPGESGRYENPDYMRYELSVEPYTVALPAGVKQEASGPLSSIFTPQTATRGAETPLRRVVIRVYREELGPDSAIPLVALLALPPPSQADKDEAGPPGRPEEAGRRKRRPAGGTGGAGGTDGAGAAEGIGN